MAKHASPISYQLSPIEAELELAAKEFIRSVREKETAELRAIKWDVVKSFLRQELEAEANGS